MVVNRGIKSRSSQRHPPQSNGIAERSIQKLMAIARSQLVKPERGEQFWMLAIEDGAFEGIWDAALVPGR